MPSPRRIRLLMATVLATVVLILFYTSGLNEGREPDTRTFQDFYQKTLKVMDGKGPPRGQAVVDAQTGNRAGRIPADKDADGDVDADDQVAAQEMQQRLRAAELAAKDKANEKGGLRPDPPSNIVGVGSSAEGQAKKGKGGSAANSKDAAGDKSPAKVEETPEEHKAEQELNLILKKSPVIIFSKTYCPFSKRAKGVLLEKYSINPAPYVVELDEHELGPQLQDQLLETTGRRTVPNIMINGVSIGGADDIIELDNDDKLVAKIIELGNKRVEVSERFVTKNTKA